MATETRIMKCLLLCFLIIPGISYAQKDSALIYSEIVVVDSASQEQLFSKASTWLHISYNGFRVELNVQDKEYGHLGGKGYCVGRLDKKDIREITGWETSYTFSFDLWTVERKYKYAITDIYNDESNLLTLSTENPTKYPLASQKRSDEIWSADKKAFDRKIQSMMESLKLYMASARE
jgi:hypothetical protein